jgi:perosamine synthetase
MNIPFAKPVYFGNEKEYLNEAFDSTWISSGPFNEELQCELEGEFGTSVLLTSNGTSALSVALWNTDLGREDSVIVPGFCFQAAANLVQEMGANPIFIDVDLDTWQIDPELIPSHLYKDTVAVVAVHNYGYPCDMNKIMAVANHYKIPVIEDCAEAIFTRYKDKYVGTFGDFGTFSFHATKTLAVGEGGMILINNPENYLHSKWYMNHGLEKRGSYNHEFPGNNFRMSNLQAAIGLGQFENRDKIIYKKQSIIRKYLNRLMNQDGIIFRKPFYSSEYVLWSFPIRLDLSVYKQGRDKVIEQLKEKEIETRPGFVPASKLDYFNTGKLPNSEVLGESVLVLPSFLSITNKEIDYICSTLLDLRS